MRTLKTVLIASALRTQLGFIYVLGCSCNAVGEGFPRRYLARLSPHTRAGRVPASYPTTSTRRLMNPTADARTGRKAYADCRRDCRNTGINIQTGQREVNTRALLPVPGCGDFGVDFVECHFGGTSLLGIGGKLLHENLPITFFSPANSF